MGHGWLDVLPAHRRDLERVFLTRALECGETRVRTWAIAHPDGHKASVAITIVPEIRNNATIGFVATVIDMTASEAHAKQRGGSHYQVAAVTEAFQVIRGGG